MGHWLLNDSQPEGTDLYHLPDLQSKPRSSPGREKGGRALRDSRPLPFPTRSGPARTGHLPTGGAPALTPAPLRAPGGREGGCGESFLGRGGVTASPHRATAPLTGAALAPLLTASSA